ncbi:MAG: tautomerase family protein [Firmicutes bacterium]|nr:tautomerase family protein [Bacillota bacterium]
MPHIDVSLYPGRTPEIKENIAKKIETLFIEELGFQPEHVSVSLTDTPPETFTEDVLKRVDNANVIVESELITK